MAAGFTLLQRSAPLVRALVGRRSAILLPNGPAFLTALAASDGRGAVLLDSRATGDEVAVRLRDASVGAVFTNAALAPRLPDGYPHVLLDDAPTSAVVQIGADAAPQRIDLGSHFGLELAGEEDAPGRDEECVLIGEVSYSHRALIDRARSVLAEPTLPQRGDLRMATGEFVTRDGLVRELIVPLIAGARVSTA